MGSHPAISKSRWPRQSTYLYSKVSVCFHYDTTDLIPGTVVRDDIEEPFKMIIKLDDGRYVLSTECQYHFE